MQKKYLTTTFRHPYRVAFGILFLLYSPTTMAGPILHEYVPLKNVRRSPPKLNHNFRAARSIPRLSAIRNTPLSLDRNTKHQGRIRYQAVFDPTVIPFKRLASYDSVDANFRLKVKLTQKKTVNLTPFSSQPDLDTFGGKTELYLHPNQLTPLPSVASSATLSSYKTLPDSFALNFYKDSAGNFWIKPKDSIKGKKRIILSFLTQAPKRYFNPILSDEFSLDHIPKHLRPKVSPNVKRATDKVCRHIGILQHEKKSFSKTLHKLVSYFRSFENKKLNSKEKNIYLDIALGQKGVCRHRSFAFVITALAIGIPARYVQNEAHAFVEVFIPRHGWSRIDLGGAPSDIEVSNRSTQKRHRVARDPFARPRTFSQGSSQQQSQARVSSSSTTSRSTTKSTAAIRARQRRTRRPRNETRSPGSDLSSIQKKPTSIVLQSHQIDIVRGQALRLWGSIQSKKQGVSGLVVEIYLKNQKNEKFYLGSQHTDSQGIFRFTHSIGREIAPGRYNVYASTIGNQHYSASVSR